jgi:hypothetical protein
MPNTVPPPSRGLANAARVRLGDDRRKACLDSQYGCRMIRPWGGGDMTSLGREVQTPQPWTMTRG